MPSEAMPHDGGRWRVAAERPAHPGGGFRRIDIARAPRRLVGLAIALLLLPAGCAAPIDESWRSAPQLPYRSRPPHDSAPFVHCNDRTGHRAGEIPWIFGGTCLCNPSLEGIRDLRAAGASASWTVDTLSAYYRSLGVATVDDHRDCNNLCEFGPHLRKGGRCLVPPTPGTLNYEEVVTGDYALPPWDVERVVALGGPLQPRDIPGAPIPPPPAEETAPDAAGPGPDAGAGGAGNAPGRDRR